MNGSRNGLRYSFEPQPLQETPLFERQSGTDDFEELAKEKKKSEFLQERIMQLEKINVDLEKRLEEQAKASMLVEKECLLVEQRWQAKNAELLEEIEKLKRSFKQEKLKGDRLREQVHRSERELYGILQRKYELMRGPGTNKHPPNIPNGKGPGQDGFISREIASAASMRDSELLGTKVSSRYVLKFLHSFMILYMKMPQ